LSEEKDHNKEEKELRKEKARELWDQTGFHRPLGGFFYNYIFLIVLLVPGLIVLGVVIPEILPFPEALGFNAVTTGLLNVFFIAFDFGMVEMVTRYVGETSTSNPKKAIRYVSFFIWFQLFTGLAQVTVVSIFAITWLPQTDLAYASWFFLVFVLAQSIQFSDAMQYALGGFQQFNKETIVKLTRDVVIQSITQVGFILLGRWWGALNPEIGELMGSVMGFIVGSYIDNLLAFGLGAYLFNQVIKPFGFKFKEIFLFDFDKKQVKEILKFGIKVLPSRLGFYATEFIITIMITSWLYNYSTLAGLYSIAFAITKLLEVAFSIGAPIAESYNNGKTHLTKYIIEEQLRWWSFISIGILTIPILFFIPTVLILVAQDYGQAAFMIFFLFFGQLLNFPSDFPGQIARNADMPGTSTILEAIKQITTVFSYLLALAPWGVATWFGREYVIAFWLLAITPGVVIKLILGWIIVNKKIVKIKFPLFQMLVSTPLAIIPLILLTIAINNILLILIDISTTLFYVAAGLTLLGYFFVFPALITFPLIGFFGGFDKRSLEHFENAVIISGPSHFLANIIYKTSLFGYKHSPFKERFMISFEKADMEAAELIEIRKQFKSNEG